MNYRLKVTIPYLPKTVNALGRKHWAVKKKEIDLIHTIMRHVIAHRLPPKPLTKASLILTRRSSSEPDFDGLVSSFKHVVDSLIKCGVLENDKMTNIGQPEYIWEKTSPKKGNIIVEVIG